MTVLTESVFLTLFECVSKTGRMSKERCGWGPRGVEAGDAAGRVPAEVPCQPRAAAQCAFLASHLGCCSWRPRCGGGPGPAALGRGWGARPGFCTGA